MTDLLVNSLLGKLDPDLVKADLADRLQWAGDASIYHLVPRVVVLPRVAEDVRAVMVVAQAHQVPVCFRAGGTSLSGQAVTDGILIVVSRYMREIAVLDNGERVQCGPGAVGAWVNAALQDFHKRIGPDPASIQAAEIGGIVANNASGMCCGVHENSYRTIVGLDLMLANGFRINTGDADADAHFAKREPQLYQSLLSIRDRIRADTQLAAQIEKAFQTKNTVGYSLNAFLDADKPADILQKLVVGSEGTLAFINQATFACVDIPSQRATALLLFKDVEAAGSAVEALAASGAAAIELLDAISLERVRDKLPSALPEGAETAALLVEYQEKDIAILDKQVQAAVLLAASFDLVNPAAFTREAAVQAQLWAVRKGLFPSVGAVRKAKTAVVIEDITFPVARLAEGVRALRTIFVAYDYNDGVIFGHAKDGNLHFTLTPDFSQAEEVERYREFMDALAECVLGFGGHLKAEHGTGRNMAPFVEAQWGAKPMAFMREIKALLDPQGILNPGVLLSDDDQAHIKHLKLMPEVDAVIDRCIECGFCEPVCPSRDATLSPRQRITLLRHAAKGYAEERAVKKIWKHAALDTCAADGMCASACPVTINTGDLVKAERGRRNGAVKQWLAARIAANFSAITWTAKQGLRVLRFMGLRRLPGRSVPLPAAAPAVPTSWDLSNVQRRVVYMPSCLSRSFHSHGLSAPLALQKIAAAAQVQIVIPVQHKQLCCGQPFASKGFPAQADYMQQRIVEQLQAIKETHEKIVIIDTSTCAAQLASMQAALPDWKILHPAAAIEEIFMPLLEEKSLIQRSDVSIVLHPTCSERKQQWLASLDASAGHGARVQMPKDGGCCGMAGDRGWLEPTLTAAATARESHEVKTIKADKAACTNLACGLALEASTGQAYEHLWSVVAAQIKEQ